MKRVSFVCIFLGVPSGDFPKKRVMKILRPSTSYCFFGVIDSIESSKIVSPVSKYTGSYSNQTRILLTRTTFITFTQVSYKLSLERRKGNVTNQSQS